jgi:hypothetical protein
MAGAVALSAALIVCVACAMSSVQGALNHQIAATVGAADVAIRPAGSGKVMPEGVLEKVKGWPEVAGAVGRLQATLALSIKKDFYAPARSATGKSDGPAGFVKHEKALSSTALGSSTTSLVVPTINEQTARRSGDLKAAATLAPPPDLVAGRLPREDDEIVIDALLAYRLSYEYALSGKHRDGMIPGQFSGKEAIKPSPANLPGRVEAQSEADRFNDAARVHLGDTVDVVKQLFQSIERPILLPNLRPPARLRVVGIAGQPPLGGRPQAYMTLP